jgi:hypothetical protein
LLPDADDGVADRLAGLAFGSKTVAEEEIDLEDETEGIDLLVAKGGIEPPTQGFSVLCSTD